VINWKLVCVPLLDNIKGHREPRVFKFQRADINDAKSAVVMRVKLHMGAIKNEAYFPKDGWIVWASDARPEVNRMTFLPKKKIDVDGLHKSLDFLRKKKYIPRVESKQVDAFLKAKGEQNEATCDKCMAFRARQLTHKSSKAHTDVERIAHRRVRDAINADFNKHLFDDRSAHPIPTSNDCWPIGLTDTINRQVQAVDADDTDSDDDGANLEDGELLVDQIGKEVMSVGRVQYTQLKPLKLGYMVALYVNDPNSKEDFWIGRCIAWDKDGGENKLKVHWYGHTDNKGKDEDDRLYFRGERKRNSSNHSVWVPHGKPLAKGLEWVETQPQSSLLYWAEKSFVTVKGKVKYYPMKKIRARLDYVKNNLGHNE
jgi:hypothetical protein